MNREDFEAHHAHEESGGKMDGEEVTRQVIGMAIKIHRALGPGLFERTYEDCLELELSRAGLRFQRQVELHLVYEGVRFPRCYRRRRYSSPHRRAGTGGPRRRCAGRA